MTDAPDAVTLYDRLGGDGAPAPWQAVVQHSEKAETIHMALPKHWEPAVGLVRAGEVLRNVERRPYALIHQADRLGGGWFSNYTRTWLRGTGL